MASDEIAASNGELLLRAILAVLLDNRTRELKGDPGATRPELLLADVGMPYGQIAALLGKQVNAVRMTVTRARRKLGSDEESGD